MNDAVWEYRLGQIETLLAESQKATTALEKRVQDFEAAEAERERRWLVYGLVTLGGIVSTLITVIWSYRAAIFRGM